MKKTLSLVLTVLMAISIITVAGTAVSAAEAASVNGVDCLVGNQVEITYTLQTPGAFEDFEGHFEYSEGLKLAGVTMSDVSGVMYNDKIDGIVYYCGTSPKEPYDYKEAKVFYTATFDVVAAGAQTVKNSMYIITGTDGTLYFDEGTNNGCTEKTDVKVLEVAVDSVVLDKTEVAMNEGETVTLEATVSPEIASDKTVTWTSSDESVATVENGVVTAVKAGTATITAKAGEFAATCAVTVNAPATEPTTASTVAPTTKKPVVKVTSVKLNKTSLSLVNGKTFTLKATVAPSNAANKTLTWTSISKNVASVSAKGVVKALKPGLTTIKATAKDGSKKAASCKVTVKAQKATKLKISKKSATLAKKGKSVKIKATLSPSNVYNKQIKVTTSSKKVAKISAKKINSGKTVKITAVKRGRAKVKFVAADGSKKNAVCKITVKR